MKLMINHQTHYQYTEQACNSIQYIKMTPFNNTHQKVHYWDVSVPGERCVKQDAFKNIWITSSQRFAYEQMTIMAQGIIELSPKPFALNMTDHLNPYLFLQPTPTTLCNAEMKEFAHRLVPEINRLNLMKLSEAILQHIPYLPNQTSVKTSSIDAFQDRQGVCQDHSHVFIAMCKALGLPARYVSGYLFVPNTSHLASHAWAEVFLDNTWYCFDTSNQLFSPEAHVYVAVGRDYWDVAPIRGVREKGGIESMHSIVQVLAC
ncbi:transglutaminase family protein [Acinetobacter kanungonis]|uniref:transglutaminase family protein n=1 Tax=Acinetobacter kanungonis TaxID=2699469 RepID=UPI001379CC39|nr:transglutaminase family protein [Acinetobacter kanungonis]NCI79417.1 transglutaminase family protein [Acinetobacter kanungonis]